MKIINKYFVFSFEEKLYYNQTAMPCEKEVKKIIARALNIAIKEVTIKITYGHLDSEGRYAKLEEVKVPVYDYEQIADYLPILSEIDIQTELANEFSA